MREGRKPEIADGILAAVKEGLEMRPEDIPKVDAAREQMQVNPALADLLRVLLKAKSESLGVMTTPAMSMAPGETKMPLFPGAK